MRSNPTSARSSSAASRMAWLRASPRLGLVSVCSMTDEIGIDSIRSDRGTDSIASQAANETVSFTLAHAGAVQIPDDARALAHPGPRGVPGGHEVTWALPPDAETIAIALQPRD